MSLAGGCSNWRKTWLEVPCFISRMRFGGGGMGVGREEVVVAVELQRMMGEDWVTYANYTLKKQEKNFVQKNQKSSLSIHHHQYLV